MIEQLIHHRDTGLEYRPQLVAYTSSVTVVSLWPTNCDICSAALAAFAKPGGALLGEGSGFKRTLHGHAPSSSTVCRKRRLGMRSKLGGRHAVMAASRATAVNNRFAGAGRQETRGCFDGPTRLRRWRSGGQAGGQRS